MAGSTSNFMMTPGVFFSELDQSQYLAVLSTSILAIVTTASRGPINTLFMAGSLQEQLNKFGPPSVAHPGLQVAREWFQNGGARAWMVRVGSDATKATVNVPVLTLIASDVTANSTDFTVAAPSVEFELPNVPLIEETVKVKFGGNIYAEDDGAGNLAFFHQLNLITIAGTITAGNIVTLNIVNADLTGGTEAIVYTVVAGDSVSTIAAALASLINVNADCIAHSITAVSSSGVLTIRTGNSSTTTFTYTLGSATNKTITNISQAANAVVTSATHGLSTGNVIFITGVVGMTQVNNLPFTITVVDANTFTIGVNSTGYTAYGSAGSAAVTTVTVGVGSALTSYNTWTGEVNYDTGLVTVNAVGLAGTQTINVVVQAKADGTIVINSIDEGTFYNNVILDWTYGTLRSQTIAQSISVLEQANPQSFAIQSVGITTGTVGSSGNTITGSGTSFVTNGVVPGMQIGIGSTSPAAITNWFTITSVNSATSLTILGSAGTIAPGASYVIVNAFVPLAPGTIVVKFNGTTVATDDSNGVLTFTGIQATWFTGTVDYYTGLVTINCTGTNAGSGHITGTTVYSVTVASVYYATFTLQVLYANYDANGKFIGEYVLEQFNNLTLANFYETMTHSNTILPAATTPPGWFPLAGRYQMSGGTNGTAQDIDYIGNTIGAPTGLQLFGPKSIDCNIIMIPKASSTAAVRAAMLDMASKRMDSIVVIDPPINADLQGVVDWANGVNSYYNYGVLNDNRAATYFPYWNNFNPLTNATESMPPSGAAAQAFARSSVAQAPAGLNRGSVQGLTTVDKVLTPGDQQFLYANRINAICDINGAGVCVWGQKTATLTQSSLDRIGARMVLMWIEKAICTALYSLLMEQADDFTYAKAVHIVQPYLNGQVASRNIRYGQFFCSEKENPPAVVNNNMLVANCQLILPKYAEIILVNFILNDVGATISENIANIPTATSRNS